MDLLKDDYFVEISLNAVLHKAVELEEALRTCRTKAEAENTGGEHISSRHQNLSSFLSKIVSGKDNNKVDGLESVNSLPPSDQWHKLTSYIVSLEKEVQFYKELVQDIQTSRDTNHVTSQQSPRGDITLSNGIQAVDKKALVIHQGSRRSALLCVFSYLSIKDLCRASIVCHEWLAVTRHPSLWKKLVFSEIMLHPKALSTMSKWCTSMEALVLHGLMPPMAGRNEDLQSYISNTRGSLEPALKALMEANHNSLHTLSITECNLMTTERVLWLASIHCPNLQSLKYCSDEFPPTSNSLWSLANGCRQLQFLNLPPVLGSPHAEFFNDSCLLVIGHSWPSLLSLTVGGSAITVKGLIDIAQRCRRLEYLELIHGPCLHKEAIEELCNNGGLSSLIRLVLNFTPTSHVALKLLSQKCSHLQSIELHVTFSSYFSEKDEESAVKYNKIVYNLKRLKRNSPFKDILYVHEH